MKKLLTLIVSSALAFSLMACSSQSTAGESTNAAAGNTNTAAENPSAAAETAEEVSAETEEARPELAAQVENWDSYDMVFVGYPNWWSDAPMAVYTFLESCDWTGKTLVPFNTSASGGFGRSLSGIEESAAGAEVLEGLDLTESELPDAESRISEWLTGLGLTL